MIAETGKALHIAGMPNRFRSPLNDFVNDPDAERRAREGARNFMRNIRTRDGKVWFTEAVLFLVTALVELLLIIDTVKTGSWRSAGIVALLFLLTFWPFLRHRLLRGDWPNDYS